jgi:predicted DNA binding protein
VEPPVNPVVERLLGLLGFLPVPVHDLVAPDHDLTDGRDVPRDVVAVFGSELWHVEFDTREAADDALAELEIQNDFTFESREAIAFDDYFDLVRTIGPAKELIDACRELTEVERATLERALEEGYHETPRDATLATLAEVFDVSNTAVSKNLRRGEGKVVRRLVQALRELD